MDSLLQYHLPNLNIPSPQSTWTHITQTYSPHVIEFYGTLLVQLIFFWLPAIAYTTLDTLVPQFSARHKLQPPQKQPTPSEIRHCFLVVLRNQAQNTLISLALRLLSTHQNKPSALRVTPSFPPLLEFTTHFLLCWLGREFLFYLVHRLFHIPYFYKRFHKMHHEFTAPVALAAQYAHPVEQFLANTLPIAIPPLVLRTNILTMWAFLAYQLVETATVHSGYDFLREWAKGHDLHHERFVGNYGAAGWMDWICRTRTGVDVGRWEGRGSDGKRKGAEKKVMFEGAERVKGE